MHRNKRTSNGPICVEMLRASRLQSTSWASIGRFQAIKTVVSLIFSFITGDKTEFLSQMMFSNEYITGI